MTEVENALYLSIKGFPLRRDLNKKDDYGRPFRDTLKGIWVVWTVPVRLVLASTFGLSAGLI